MCVLEMNVNSALFIYARWFRPGSSWPPHIFFYFFSIHIFLLSGRLFEYKRKLWRQTDNFLSSIYSPLRHLSYSHFFLLVIEKIIFTCSFPIDRKYVCIALFPNFWFNKKNMRAVKNHGKLYIAYLLLGQNVDIWPGILARILAFGQNFDL